MNNILRHPLAIALAAVSLPVCSLEAISDREMAEVSGQAFITIGADSYSSTVSEWTSQGYSNGVAQELAGDYEFTRVNLGLDIETLATVDSLRVGEFERTVYEDGTVPATDLDGNPIDANGNITSDPDQFVANDADIIIDNFALGRVENYRDATQASVDPFQIRNPYIELAYKIVDGVREVAGVRIGFEEAQGYLSGDIKSLTGTFKGSIIGPVSVIVNANCPRPDGTDADSCGLLELAVALGDPDIESTIDLVDGAKGTANYGYGAGREVATEGPSEEELTYPYEEYPYLKRASWAGVPAGRNFDTPKFDLLGIDLSGIIRNVTVSEDCQVDYTPGCFNLQIYQSVYIGDETLPFDDEGEGSGTASGVFVSLQQTSVPWKDLSGLPDADRVATQRGAYLHAASFNSNGVEKYPLVLDLYDATSGIPREATCVGVVKGC
ncbi:hypothetical protein [Thalassolituus maritimus]|uniref:Uncharacterized protein n=1 Tax=Thalassolituus maritimus TaxID=484498 RepID=A0ABQ0A3E6_9GAMM